MFGSSKYHIHKNYEKLLKMKILKNIYLDVIYNDNKSYLLFQSNFFPKGEATQINQNVSD